MKDKRCRTAIFRRPMLYRAFDDGPTGKSDGYPNGLTNYLLDGARRSCYVF